MSDKKVIAVVGATGAQGGGLVRAILNDPSGGFAARAITRDPRSDKARALAALGAEVVQADLDDRESVRRAFEGAHAAFCNTFFWEHHSPEKEQMQARFMAEAARDARVAHAIWSTLEDARKHIPLSDDRMPTLMGRYKVPHTDGKAEMDAVFTNLGVPTTFLVTSFYWENFIFFGMGPQPDANGRLAITFPMGDRKLPGIAAEDIGRCAYAIFKRGRDMVGRTVGIAGEHLSGEEMARTFTRVLGVDVRYNEISPDAYRRLGFPGAEDLGNMFQFKRDFNDVFRAVRNIEHTRALNPALMTFERWLQENKSRIPLPATTRG